MQNIISSLNPPQREAVEAIDGPLLVLAGAGTGKTRVLTTRLANIIAAGKARPTEIMAVTFTNKASKEMQERVEKLIGQPTTGMWLGTFHSISARILRMHPEAVGLDRDFTIIDMDDQKRLLKEMLTRRNIDITRWPAKDIMSLIAKWKDNAWNPTDVPKDEAALFAGIGVELYQEYQSRLQALNAADFGDLLLKCLNLFKQRPDILEKFQNKFKYVLVDEYQDTNAVQYLWLRLLVMSHKNICVVGDDDQSIYGWRGAQVGNILKFEQDFPGAKIVRLEQNYRSTGHILTAASGLIGNNSERHGKKLWTDIGDGEQVEVHPVFDDREESRLIADRIARHVSDGGKYEDCAVLVRTSSQTRPVEEKFIKDGVPYQVIGGLRFYERKEIRDALAYLRLVSNDKDDLAFQRIINVPKRGIGEASINELKEQAEGYGNPLLAATRHAVQNGMVAARVLGKLSTFVNQIDGWRNRSLMESPDRMMEAVLEESGYLEMLRNDKNDDAKARIDNLKELVRAMQEYADIGSFLEHVSLVMDLEVETTDSAKIITVHGAKGLEFDTVFIPGFEDGLFPHQRSLNESNEKGIEEERRLAYVAITRARRKLILSHASSRRLYGGWQPAVASRFLEEIPVAAVKTVGSARMGEGQFRPQQGSSMDRGWSGGRTKRAMPMVGYSKPAATVSVIKKADASIDPGTKVFHQKFGYGRVAKTEGVGEAEKIVINFDKAGTKKLLSKLANLDRV